MIHLWYLIDYCEKKYVLSSIWNVFALGSQMNIIGHRLGTASTLRWFTRRWKVKCLQANYWVPLNNPRWLLYTFFQSQLLRTPRELQIYSQLIGAEGLLGEWGYSGAKKKSVSYCHVKDIVNGLLRLGCQGQYLSKMDIRDAFEIIPIRRKDWLLLGFHHIGKYYIDNTLLQGLVLSVWFFSQLV